MRTKISPPWVTFINEMLELFEGDPQITCNVNWSGTNPSIILSTQCGDKAAALLQLLPYEKKYGNVTLAIGVDGPVSNRAFKTTKELFETAFEGNPVFEYCFAPTQEGYWFVDYTYVVFKREVVQFFNDNLDDAHGVVSTLYQNIAADIFSEAHLKDNVAYCTDVPEPDKLSVKVTNWP